MVTDLGCKIFLMFATINIGGMATFALYVSPLLYSPSFSAASTSTYARAALTGTPFAGPSRRRRAAVWRRWTSSSARSRRTSGRPTSRGKNEVGLAFTRAPDGTPTLTRLLRLFVLLALEHDINETTSERSIEQKV